MTDATLTPEVHGDFGLPLATARASRRLALARAADRPDRELAVRTGCNAAGELAACLKACQRDLQNGCPNSARSALTEALLHAEFARLQVLELIDSVDAQIKREAGQ